MALETESDYNPRLDHPLYTKIVPPNQNSYELFKEYTIRIPDEDRGDDGPYNEAFDALLVGIEEVTWSEIPALLKAYTAKERDARKAEEAIHPLGSDGNFSDDDELLVLFFLRTDETKKYITTDADVLVAQAGDVE